MPEVSLCPRENVNWSKISKPPDGTGVVLYVKDLICPKLLCHPSWWKNENAVKFHVRCAQLWYLFFIMIAQAYGSVSNDDALYNFISNFWVYPSYCFTNVVIPWSHSCCDSKSIQDSFVVWVYTLWFNPDNNILQFTFQFEYSSQLIFVAYISNVTVCTSFQMLP